MFVASACLCCTGEIVAAVFVCMLGLSALHMARGMLMLLTASGLEENLFTIAEFADEGVRR